MAAVHHKTLTDNMVAQDSTNAAGSMRTRDGKAEVWIVDGWGNKPEEEAAAVQRRSPW